MGQNGKLNIYRSCTPVVDAVYERDSERTITETLVYALAEAEGVDAMDLPSIYDAIDLDAIANLFAEHDGAADAHALLTFTFGIWNVFVRADGRIRVCDGTQDTSPEPVFDGSTA